MFTIFGVILNLNFIIYGLYNKKFNCKKYNYPMANIQLLLAEHVAQKIVSAVIDLE